MSEESSTSHAPTHKEMVNKLVASVRSVMSKDELSALPAETSAYINAITKKALSQVETFKPALAELVGWLYHNSPKGERFLLSPDSNGPVFVDRDGEIVIMNNAQINTGGDETKYIHHFDSYQVLTGLNKGKTFGSFERGIPPPTVPQVPNIPGPMPG